MDKTAISVVIPALNEEKYIGNTLRTLMKQRFKNFETIVVDNRSTDRTGKIARSFSGVKVVLEKKRGIASARNAGAKVARGDVILFLDADTRPSEELLQHYHRAFRNPRVVAATGPVYPLERVRKRVKLGYEIVSVLFVKSSIALGQPSIVGLNFAVRRSAFERVGRFNEKLATYEDYDLSRRLKKAGKIVFLDNAVVHSSARRVKAWGLTIFFLYHAGNMLKYGLFRRPNKNYEPVR